MVRDLFLAIDVGTGGIRSALVNHNGEVLKICHKEHEQIVPRYGWSEQRPADWWSGTIETISKILDEVDCAQARVAAICACGHNGLLLRRPSGIHRVSRQFKSTLALLDLVVHLGKHMLAISTPIQHLVV